MAHSQKKSTGDYILAIMVLLLRKKGSMFRLRVGPNYKKWKPNINLLLKNIGNYQPYCRFVCAYTTDQAELTTIFLFNKRIKRKNGKSQYRKKCAELCDGLKNTAVFFRWKRSRHGDSNLAMLKWLKLILVKIYRLWKSFKPFIIFLHSNKYYFHTNLMNRDT